MHPCEHDRLNNNAQSFALRVYSFAMARLPRGAGHTNVTPPVSGGEAADWAEPDGSQVIALRGRVRIAHRPALHYMSIASLPSCIQNWGIVLNRRTG